MCGTAGVGSPYGGEAKKREPRGVRGLFRILEYTAKDIRGIYRYLYPLTYSRLVAIKLGRDEERGQCNVREALKQVYFEQRRAEEVQQLQSHHDQVGELLLVTASEYRPFAHKVI